MCQSRAPSMILDAEVLLSFCCHHRTLGCDQCLLNYWWWRTWKVRIQTYFIRAKSDNNAFWNDCVLCDSGCRLMWECGSLFSLSAALNVLIWIDPALWLARSVGKSFSLENMIVFTNCPDVCMQGLVFAQYCIKQLLYVRHCKKRWINLSYIFVQLLSLKAIQPNL